MRKSQSPGVPADSVMTESTQPLIVFVHIPKAGGMTVNRIMKDVYGDRLFHTNVLVGPEERWPAETIGQITRNRGSYDAFAGHCAFGIHELFNRPGRYFTIIRHPLDRMESYYNFVRRWEIHHHHDAACRLGIADFIQFMIDTDDVELGNLQCLLVCGEKSFTAARSRLVRSFDFAVPLPQLADGLRVLAKGYAWGEIREVPRENTTQHANRLGELPASLFQAVSAANAEDQSLYDFCVESWQRFRQLDPCVEGPAGKRAQFRDLSP